MKLQSFKFKLFNANSLLVGIERQYYEAKDDDDNEYFGMELSIHLLILTISFDFLKPILE